VRILIVSATLPPEGTAVGQIINSLIPHFQQNGFEVEGLTYKYSMYDPDVSEFAGIRIHHAAYVHGFGHKKRGIADYLLAIRKKMVYCGIGASKVRVFRRICVKPLVKKLNQLRANEYDVVMAVCAFYDAAEAVRHYCEKAGRGRAKYTLYQVDPLAGNYAYRSCSNEKLQEYEKSLYSMMDSIFTTPVIWKEKQKANWNMHGVTTVEFPGIQGGKRETFAAKRSDNQLIRCVFAGYLYDEIRNARYTLELFSHMANTNIHLYVLGAGQEALLKDYSNGELKGRLHLLGSKSLDECNEWLESADVLVNIGNSVLNQIPSKLFTYMCIGKPILNTCKSLDCPTLRYGEFYPLMASTIENEENVASEATRIEKYILEHVGQRVSSEDIEARMRQCTPKYVARVMMNQWNS